MTSIAYPETLIPIEKEPISIDEYIFEIPKCIIKFEKYNGEEVTDTFGGKPIISLNGRPVFAELVIMNYFIADGWNSRWVETYGKGKMNPMLLSKWEEGNYKSQEHNPITNDYILDILKCISSLNGNSFYGCWDVLAWKGDKIIFAESKRTKKDSIRDTQINWLKAAFQFGLNTDNFLMVEWDI
jgi:hypothetical protein